MTFDQLEPFAHAPCTSTAVNLLAIELRSFPNHSQPMGLPVEATGPLAELVGHVPADVVPSRSERVRGRGAPEEPARRHSHQPFDASVGPLTPCCRLRERRLACLVSCMLATP